MEIVRIVKLNIQIQIQILRFQRKQENVAFKDLKALKAKGEQHSTK
jgi:hypothetical protein